MNVDAEWTDIRGKKSFAYTLFKLQKSVRNTFNTHTRTHTQTLQEDISKRDNFKAIHLRRVLCCAKMQQQPDALRFEDHYRDGTFQVLGTTNALTHGGTEK